MYNCGQEALSLLKKDYRQIARISFEGENGHLDITEADILPGTLNIDRYSVTGESVELGCATAAQFDVKLKNDDGRFDNVVFEGGEMFVRIGVKKWDAHRWENAQIHWIPCGYFLVDTPPRKQRTITISALDRMVLFSDDVDAESLIFPMTVQLLVNTCCNLCNVNCVTDLSVLPNHDYVIDEVPSEQALTYRTLIQWCAAIMGTCAWMNEDGALVFGWYAQTGESIFPRDRHESDLQENDITLTGFSFSTADKHTYLVGTDDHALDLTGNGLIQSDPEAVLTALYAARGGFTYRPFTAKIKAAPYLWPMDMVKYVDAKGAEYGTVLTGVNYALNGNTAIVAKGETKQISKYAGGNALTKRQIAILEKMKEEQRLDLSGRQQALLHMNELLGNSLGLNTFTVEEDDGTTSYYFGSGSTLADSGVIYTFKAAGFAWTNDWNDGDPVWQYGFSRDGNAILNALSVYKLTADLIEAGILTDAQGRNSWNLDTGEFRISASDGSTVGGETIATENDVARVRTYVDVVNNDLTISISEIRETSDGRYEEITSYVQYKDGVLKLGKSDSPSNLRLNNEGIGVYMNDELTSFWNQDKQLTPKQLEIPVGGSMRIGDVQWQPRTSGNLSLFWVGDKK